MISGKKIPVFILSVLTLTVLLGYGKIIVYDIESVSFPASIPIPAPVIQLQEPQEKQETEEILSGALSLSNILAGELNAYKSYIDYINNIYDYIEIAEPKIPLALWDLDNGENELPAQKIQAGIQINPENINANINTDANTNVNVIPGIDLKEYAAEVLRLINIERRNAGLTDLAPDAALTNTAVTRAKEIITLFSHDRPDGRDCFTAYDENSVSYRTAAENIAAGQRTPEKVVESWMNSPGHKANILYENFGRVGVGVEADSDGKLYWSMNFTD